MTARDKLFSRICNHTGISDLEANDLIDAYAHELAEKIRSASPFQDNAQLAVGASIAADLIDPEVDK